MTSLREREQAADQTNTPLVSWALLLVLIGIIPWAMYCMNTLLPALGITRMKMGALIGLILVPPAVILSVVFKINAAKQASKRTSSAAAEAARARRAGKTTG